MFRLKNNERSFRRILNLSVADNADPTEPPVPPRRRKREMKTAAPTAMNSATTEATNNDAELEQKRPPPLPPLPPPPEIHRRNRFAVEDHGSPRCDVARENSTTNSNTANDGPSAGKSRSLPFPVSCRGIVAPSSEPTIRDGYPSLFFTLRDFEDVMSATRSKSDSANETIAANLEDARSFARSETRGSCEETESRGMLDDDNDDNDDVCFRVTTTNLPFEKCLDGWKNRFGDDAFARKFDDFGFGDSTDGSASVDLDDDSDHRRKVRFAIESPSPVESNRDRNGTIGAPFDGLRNGEFILGESNEREIKSEQNAASCVRMLTEIREDSTRVEDGGGNKLRDKSGTLSAEERNFATTRENDPFTRVDANNVDTTLKSLPEARCYHHDDKRDNDVERERVRREDSDSISCHERVENEHHLGISKESRTRSADETDETNEMCAATKQINQRETSVATWAEIAVEYTRHFTNENTARGNEEEANVTGITGKRTDEIFSKRSDKDNGESERVVGESLGNLLNDLASRDHLASGSNERIPMNDLANGSPILLDSQRSSIEERENRITNDSADPETDREKASRSNEIFTKSVPVKVRRSSFLEAMLADDPTDISIEYAMISTDSSVTPTPRARVKGSSTPNESAVRELDTNSARARERPYHGFDNDAINAHTQNRKVVENTGKTRERATIGTPSTDARSTQSASKSAGDAKSDVLKELLCNLSNVKLKIASPENKRPPTRTDDEKSIIARPVAIDEGISTEKASSNLPRVLEERRDEAVDGVVETDLASSIGTIGANENDAGKGVTKIAKSKRVSAIAGLDRASFDANGKTGNDPVKSKADEKNVRSEGTTRAGARIEKTPRDTENEVNGAGAGKSRDVGTPKATLERKSAECEQTSQSGNSISIGTVGTMNAIFDSKERKTIAERGSRSGDDNLDKHAAVISRETRGEKTAEGTSDEAADADPTRITSRSALSLAECATNNDDKCAITGKTTSAIPCNNNDDNNGAVTAVASVSNDQSSRDVVTITLGKIRSFVKYYEIRGDATIVEGQNSKINDREKLDKRKSTRNPEIMAERKETESGRFGSNDAAETSLGKMRLSSRMPKSWPSNSNREKSQAESRLTQQERQQRTVHSHVPLAKSDARRTMRFSGDFTVIRSETFDENEESAGIVADHDANVSREAKRVPGIPSSRDSEEHVREIAKLVQLPDAEKDFLPEIVLQVNSR